MRLYVEFPSISEEADLTDDRSYYIVAVLV